MVQDLPVGSLSLSVHCFLLFYWGKGCILHLCLESSAFAWAQLSEDRKPGSPFNSLPVASNDVLISRHLSFVFHISIGSTLRRERRISTVLLIQYISSLSKTVDKLGRTGICAETIHTDVLEIFKKKIAFVG